MSLLGLGAILAASAVSSAASLYNNRQNTRNADNTNWLSVYLANTAHQREVKDLEAAGLNPILSAGGSGAVTPQLRTPNLESIDGGIGNSGMSLAKAINGQMDAEIESAEANARSDKAYAERADELAAAEVSSARAQSSIAHDQAKVAEMQSYNDRLDQLARTEALQGFRPGEVNDLIPQGKDGTYKKLVQQYKNEIASGVYKSSVGRAVTQDLLSGANSAADMYRTVRGAKQGRMKRP